MEGIRQLLSDGEVPLEKILLETDAPFMYPRYDKAGLPKFVTDQLSTEAKFALTSASNDRNEPCAMALLSEIIAGLTGSKSADLARATTLNAVNFFSLDEAYTRCSLDNFWPLCYVFCLFYLLLKQFLHYVFYNFETLHVLPVIHYLIRKISLHCMCYWT